MKVNCSKRHLTGPGILNENGLIVLLLGRTLCELFFNNTIIIGNNLHKCFSVFHRNRSAYISSDNIHMVTLNKTIVGNSWKCTFMQACNFQTFLGACPQTPLRSFAFSQYQPPSPDRKIAARSLLTRKWKECSQTTQTMRRPREYRSLISESIYFSFPIYDRPYLCLCL
jgi:hypothetical protein